MRQSCSPDLGVQHQHQVQLSASQKKTPHIPATSSEPAQPGVQASQPPWCEPGACAQITQPSCAVQALNPRVPGPTPARPLRHGPQTLKPNPEPLQGPERTGPPGHPHSPPGVGQPRPAPLCSQAGQRASAQGSFPPGPGAPGRRPGGTQQAVQRRTDRAVPPGRAQPAEGGCCAGVCRVWGVEGPGPTHGPCADNLEAFQA